MLAVEQPRLTPSRQSRRADGRLALPIVLLPVILDVHEVTGRMRTGLFVANNPIDYVDPLGLALGDWWDVGATQGYLNNASANGLSAGGFEGYLQVAGAQLAEDLIDLSGASTTASLAQGWGAASGNPCDHGNAWLLGAATIGEIGLNAIPGEGEVAGQFGKDANALIQLAKEAKRTGISPEDAQTLLEWAEEINANEATKVLPIRGPEIHPNRNYNLPHIQIGPVNHITINP